MKLNDQIVIAKINHKSTILIANDLDDMGEKEVYLDAKDIHGNNYALLWKINNGKLELYLNGNLLTPLYQYFKAKNLFTSFGKNAEITLSQILDIQEKILKLENSSENHY